MSHEGMAGAPPQSMDGAAGASSYPGSEITTPRIARRADGSTFARASRAASSSSELGRTGPGLGALAPRLSSDGLDLPAMEMSSSPAAELTSFSFVDTEDGPLMASSLSLADMLLSDDVTLHGELSGSQGDFDDYGAFPWSPNSSTDSFGMYAPRSDVLHPSTTALELAQEYAVLDPESGNLVLGLSDILPPLNSRTGALARKPHHDYTLYSRSEYNADHPAAAAGRHPPSLRPRPLPLPHVRAPAVPSRALPARPNTARAAAQQRSYAFSVDDDGFAVDPSRTNTISPAKLAVELRAMDLDAGEAPPYSNTPPSRASWTLPSSAPFPRTSPKPLAPRSLPPAALHNQDSGASAGASAGASSSSAMSTTAAAVDPLAALAAAAAILPPSSLPPSQHGGSSSLSGGDRPLPREIRRGNASFLVTRSGEFPVEDDILLWERSLGLVTVSRTGTTPISDAERSARSELHHIRCHYCVNGPNVNQKRSKWLTKCRRTGCTVWYCQTHYPMFSRTRPVVAVDGQSSFDGLRAFHHTPFVCLYDFGECCCSESNDKCSDTTSKVCKTFGQSSHKCEKVRHRVYNATKRGRKKAAAAAKRAAAAAAAESPPAAAASSSGSSGAYRKRAPDPSSHDDHDANNPRIKRQHTLT